MCECTIQNSPGTTFMTYGVLNLMFSNTWWRNNLRIVTLASVTMKSFRTFRNIALFITTPFRSIPGGFQKKVVRYFALPYFPHVCGRKICPSKTSQFMTTPYSNSPRHSASVSPSLAACMLCSRISTQHVQTQAAWRRRRVIIFGLARSISRYFVIFREKQ